MPAFLIPVLAKIAPYFLGAIALIGAYFGFKHKVAREEREKLRVQQQKAIETVQKKVEAAVQKDQKIDQTVRGKVDEVKKSVEVSKPKDETPDSYRPGDIFKF